MAKISQKKYQSDSEVVDLMIALYCRKKHKGKKGELCQDCQELKDYCAYRLSLCPWGDNKPFCSNCTIHCYNKEHREKIREVMRFSGPRMLFYHPVLAIRHVKETLKQKKKLRKQANGRKAKEEKQAEPKQGR